MRIALLAWESLHSIPVGGVGVHVTELAAALERKGHEVHVFTRMGPGQPHLERIHGVWYHRCPFGFNPNFVDEIQNMCRSFVHHLFAAEDYMGAHFDVVHAHDWLTSNAMVWIKQGRGRRVILTIHSTEYGRCGNNFWGGQSARIRDHERHGTYCADRVITVSKALKGEVMWMYNLPDWKVEVAYNGVNVHNFDGWIPDPGAIRKSYGIGPIDPMVLFSGRMTSQKGPDLLLEAVPMILRYYPRAKFVFAGEGDMRGACEHRARQMGVAHACRFLGHRGGMELHNLYKICDVVCVPSRNEPFGITILEAWSAGKPVVASKNGGPDEIVWHEVTGLKIYATPESVAWGLGTLFTNFEWARWMGRNGRVAAEAAFSWDFVADRVLGAYAT
ncbi:MAG: glycosyltransferase family 4 protein [Candidatus Tectomicrobia bacterium]|uniref:Glycosyltransferase family 4 protein n=1 Tax=Tectimicrobiota bacterium TaxID=2528274 RepID=A0A932GPP0_UNCTE|nr:glycosyltransferase family 4 protein [Candidatus Tectomicrobia bacterium]